MLPQLTHSEQFAERGLAVRASTELAEEFDERVWLQPVQNATRGVQRRGIRSPERAVTEQNSNGASFFRLLLR